MLAQATSLLLLAASVQAATSLGYLKCTSQGQVTGYVSKSLNSYGEFKGVSPDTDATDRNHRMLVTIDQAATGVQSLIVENIDNDDADYSFLGGIGWTTGVNGTTIGRDGNYVLMGGTGLTLPGAVASRCGNTFTDRTNKQRNCASAIWVYNATTNAVTPQWTNDDGTVVVGNVGYVDAAFLITGDIKQFEDVWEDKVEWLTLSLET
ncbi:hypothetical protein C8R46DRAFT_487509 [Mycena filopes]|nr:hypothetical protein C8R46DRAFT_487509 [Mycena filopes]